MIYGHYPKQQVIKAMERINKPCRDIDLYAHWKEISNLETIKRAEGIVSGRISDSFTEDDLLLMAMRAAVVDLINDKILAHNSEGLLVLAQWLPDPKRLRSLDEGWLA